MTSNTLQYEIDKAVPKLLGLAKELTRNVCSDNCKFILTEIKDSEDNFHMQRVSRKKETDKKIPVAFSELMPTLRNLYDNLYDINLYIYKSDSLLTVIDIRYYLKSSLDKEYRQKVSHNPPMLHCKVALPPWLTDKNEKFDINWEHNQWLVNWKLFWARRKFKSQQPLTKSFAASVARQTNINQLQILTSVPGWTNINKL